MAKTLAEKIAVMQAAERGEEIEMKFNSEERESWQKLDDPLWNWGEFDYRVKPKPQKFWVVFNKEGYIMCSGTKNKPDVTLQWGRDCVVEEYERKE